MTESNYWQRASRRTLSRRKFVGAAAAAGSTAWLIACGGDDNGGTTGTSATTAPTGQAGAATQAPAATAAGDVQRGGVRRTDSAQVYDSVDVHRAFGDPTSRVANQTQSKLVWYKNPDTGEIEPDVAEKYEAPDATTYTFTLRKGVKWHNVAPANGREFVADDVKWHIERQQNQKLKDGGEAPMRNNAFYKTITNIETPDKYTVKLTLNGPNGSFLDRLAAYFSTIPNREATEQFEADHRTLHEAAILGTGPFVAREFRAGKDVKLAKNPEYFRQGVPLMDGQVWTVLFEDPNAKRAAFEQKQLDGFAAGDPSLTKSIIDANKGGMYEVLTGVNNTVFLHLNMRQQFKDVRLVQAMNMAIDRRQLIQSLHQGLGQVSGPVPWVQEGFAISRDQLINNPGYRTDRQKELQEARQLWQAGGGPALGEVDIKIPRTWSAQWPDTSQIIAKMFNDALGVTQFKSTPTDYNEEIIPNLFNGQFPNWFGWTSAVNSPDPRSDLRNTFHSQSAANFQKVNNPQLDTMIMDAVATVDAKQAQDKVREIQRVLLENAQYGNVILYNYISRSAVWNYAKPPLKEQPSQGKPGTGFVIDSGHLVGSQFWINQKDPSYQGRPPATL